MGFRSTLTSGDLGGVNLPKWFIDKYKDNYYFGIKTRMASKNHLFISSKFESKYYSGKEEDVFLDLQRVIKEIDISKFVLVLLHECGGITRVQVEKNKIFLSEPTDWKEIEEITHNYCYGCSDIISLQKEK